MVQLDADDKGVADGMQSVMIGERTVTDFVESLSSNLPAEIERAISTSWRLGVPPSATALYARWWQFETWLRSLIYVELKSAFGTDWAKEIPGVPEERQLRDEEFGYMATPDAQTLLAYADLSVLLGIVGKHWRLFNASLLHKDVWAGRVVELKNIRNRIGHCRRPHSDDLARLEQTLRDLESGAFRAASAFNRQYRANTDLVDPVVDAWVKGEHEAASRLIDHAQKQYKTSFRLNWSCRPWANARDEIGPLSGTPGYVWHAHWHMQEGSLDLCRFWSDPGMEAFRDRLIFVFATTSNALEVSFSSMEDSKVVSNAIGLCFDLVLCHRRRGRNADESYGHWNEINAHLDSRVHTGSVWSIVDDSTVPISIFGA